MSFIITDFIIGYHNTTHWTWGSVLLIGLSSSLFIKNFLTRISGALFGALIFYFVTNFGVWTTGLYEITYDGLIKCYILAIPFFAYSLISTLVFSLIVESGYKYLKSKFDFKSFTQLS